MNRSFPIQLMPFLRGTVSKRGAIFGAILLSALLAFEVFNYSTTAFALTDLLGNLKFAGIAWATILAFAFCGIDFAGIARIFTPQRGRDEPTEVWYLFGAWLMAALFNAMLTWWGVSVAIMDHTSRGSVLIGEATLTKVVPVFVALMVWLILRPDYRNLLDSRQEYFYDGRGSVVELQSNSFHSSSAASIYRSDSDLYSSRAQAGSRL